MAFNLIAFFDLISSFASLSALVFLIKGWRRRFLLNTKIVLAGLFGFSLMYHFFLFMEWSGTTAALDVYEDFIGTLIPMWWAFAFFALYYGLSSRSLRRSEEKFRTVLQSTPNPIMVSDLNAKVLYVNPAFTNVFGWELDACVGKTLDKFIPAAEKAKTDALMAKLLQDETSVFNKTSRFTKDGAMISVNICGNPYKNEDGEIIGTVINLQDITEKERLEEQLRQSQKMEAIGTLAGGIAHDFNNILSLIIGYSELALEDVKKGTATHENIEEILAAGLRAKKLVRQILTFTRNKNRECEPIRLLPIVEEVETLLRATLPTTIKIEKYISADPVVVADPTQIHQVLVNLGTNAGHAMKEEGGVLSIEMDRIEITPSVPSPDPKLNCGEYAEIKVKDTGHGISAEILNRIFEPFFTTKEVGKGTGMGLAVAHGIISSIGGAITVTSELNEGATFHVFIPAMKAN